MFTETLNFAKFYCTYMYWYPFNSGNFNYQRSFALLSVYSVLENLTYYIAVHEINNLGTYSILFNKSLFLNLATKFLIDINK